MGGRDYQHHPQQSLYGSVVSHYRLEISFENSNHRSIPDLVILIEKSTLISLIIRLIKLTINSSSSNTGLVTIGNQRTHRTPMIVSFESDT